MKTGNCFSGIIFNLIEVVNLIEMSILATNVYYVLDIFNFVAITIVIFIITNN